ncbi:MAG: NAD(P)/FAD-dependent oxidoreductase [Phascolarctobacterium sp.]|nr:NAD(P)/FAD-dependent oxidoreductase [Phascolarctobacterium sp.]
MYDVGIIGGGPAAIFAAFELAVKYNGLKVLMLEAGNPVARRHCPLALKETDHCINCSPCSIMRGFGGAGAFSDGKYNFTTEFGGWLNEYLPQKEVVELIDYVDSINCKYGAPGEFFTTKNSTLWARAMQHDLHLLNAKVRHLGTENNLIILEKLYNFLRKKVEIRCNTLVTEIERRRGGGFDLILDKGKESCRYLIAAPGRAGAEWYSTQCEKMGLRLINNQIDVGLRVEVPAALMQHITDEVYEAKILFRTRQYDDMVRTFCMNPNGYVVAENTDGIITVNGHSFRDAKLRSKNTNFALLVSNKFTEPFHEPYQYGKRIASFSNMLAGGVLVQRFGDLIKGYRTDEGRMAKSFVKPTLAATPGDLSLVLPKRQCDDIIEMVYALDKIAPGVANADTLLYGVEVKFYSARPELDGNLETKIRGMFAAGDGVGITRGLAQASASGVHAARAIGRRAVKG